MTPGAARVVVTDANILIDLLRVERLALLGGLPGYEFVVPDHVREEIRYQEQRAQLLEALQSGLVRSVSIVDIGVFETFAALRRVMGDREIVREGGPPPSAVEG